MSYPLKESDIIAAVRHKLDERKINLNGTIISYGEDTDNVSLDSLISMLTPEAINTVHRDAPAPMLEATHSIMHGGLQEYVESRLEMIEDDVMDIKVDIEYVQNPFLRLVECRPAQTQRVITEVIAEDSPEGRMQLNKYVRGTWDDPRLVLLQGSSVMQPEFILYGCGCKKDCSIDSVLKEFSFIEQYINPQKDDDPYKVSYQLLDNYINHLTGMVLSVYKDADQAGYFYNLAKSY